MYLDETKDGDVAVIAVNGRWDNFVPTEFEERLMALIQSGYHRVCIDCATLTYLGTSALKAFLVAAKQLAAVGGKLAISELGASSHQVFEVVGYTKIMTLVPTRADALRDLRAGTPLIAA
jgi:anti-anti-sigma factor